MFGFSSSSAHRAVQRPAALTRNGASLGASDGQLRRAAGNGYDGSAADNVIATNRGRVATSLAARAAASNRSIKISANMAVPPKFARQFVGDAGRASR